MLTAISLTASPLTARLLTVTVQEPRGTSPGARPSARVASPSPNPKRTAQHEVIPWSLGNWRRLLQSNRGAGTAVRARARRQPRTAYRPAPNGKDQLGPDAGGAAAAARMDLPLHRHRGSRLRGRRSRQDRRDPLSVPAPPQTSRRIARATAPQDVGQGRGDRCPRVPDQVPRRPNPRDLARSRQQTDHGLRPPRQSCPAGH